MDFGSSDNLIQSRMQRGDVVLFLGAGVNAESKNRRDRDILTGGGLAAALCEEMGEHYSGEPLADVASAYEHVLGRDALNRILTREFRFTTPSDSLVKLFSYTWRRIYTWNYDDSVLIASSSSVQRVYPYNGMAASVEEIPFPSNLQLVFLHGMITEINKGLILTEQDYADALQRNEHPWYRRATQDYRASTVVFIGTSLSEPILGAELERASRNAIGSHGLSFLVTPDEITKIRAAALQKRGIIHVRGTVSEFVQWLQKNIGPSLAPSGVIQKDKYFNEANIGRFSFDDITAAQSIKPIDPAALINAFDNESDVRISHLAKAFYNGFSPSWMVASSRIPIRLKQLGELKEAIINAAKGRKDIFVTVGQAGSGKSTATMQALIDIAREGLYDVFEFTPDTKSITRAIDVLSRISDKPKIVFLQNLFVFGTGIIDDFAAARAANVMFVSTARSSEWKEHFEIHFSKGGSSFSFQRFSPDDYQPLIDKLKSYVPSPAFVKLKPNQQIERLAKSRSQLLIALREATESRNFDEVILDEFASLADNDVRELFIIAGIATLARVGVKAEDAAEAYGQNRGRDFGSALERLEGIVANNSAGRLLGRHEFYVRNILDQAVPIDTTVRLICRMLDVFTKYSIPITKHVSRTDGALFRFLLNHGFLRERSERGGDKYAGLDVYRNFEISFQLDGHFWLQYGLYYQKLGNSALAVEMLEKSIAAFPGNPFAIHALASERLLRAKDRANYDKETQRLVRMAVNELEQLDSNPILTLDQYPLVTLAKYHIPVLLRHGQAEQAVEFAKNYYERLRVMEKAISSEEITDAKGRLFKFVTLRIWEA